MIDLIVWTWEFLKGKKTYILTSLGALYAILIAFNVLPNEKWVWEALGTAAVASLRNALPTK